MFLAFCTSIVLASCAPSNTATSESPDSTNTNETNKVQISINNMSFPATTKIKKGQTVVWANKESLQHTVTFSDESSGTLNRNQTFEKTFNEIGSFTYHCEFHPTMTGRIVVEQ